MFLLVDFSTQNILKNAEENSEREANAIKAHQQLEQVSISQGAGPMLCSKAVR